MISQGINTAPILQNGYEAHPWVVLHALPGKIDGLPKIRVLPHIACATPVDSHALASVLLLRSSIGRIVLLSTGGGLVAVGFLAARRGSRRRWCWWPVVG